MEAPRSCWEAPQRFPGHSPKEGPGLAIGASAASFNILHDAEHEHISIAASLDVRTPSDNVFLREVPVDVFFAAITNFLAVRPICTLLSLLLLSGIADLSLHTHDTFHEFCVALPALFAFSATAYHAVRSNV